MAPTHATWTGLSAALATLALTASALAQDPAVPAPTPAAAAASPEAPQAPAPTATAPASDPPYSLEPVRFGVEIELMPGGPLGGSMQTSFSLQNRSWEVYMGASFFESHGYGDPGSSNGSNQQVNLELRAGKRFFVGYDNYITAGVDYAPVVGTGNGISQFPRSFTVGPYIGFAHQIRHSPVLITAFVIPYEFQSYATANNSTYTATAIFLDGGIGIDYLF